MQTATEMMALDVYKEESLAPQDPCMSCRMMPSILDPPEGVYKKTERLWYP